MQPPDRGCEPFHSTWYGPLAEDERDLAENLTLACSSCHTEIDKLLVSELIDKEFLRQRKQEHEAEIRHQTSLTKSRRTVILRMAGDVRGGAMELPTDTAFAWRDPGSDRYL